MPSVPRSVVITGDKLVVLRRLWSDAHVWMAAANGFSPAYTTPAARMMSKERAKELLDKYFNAIEEITLNGARPSDIPEREAQ